MLERMYHKRLSGYASIGYTIRGDRTVPAAENRIFSQEEYWDTFSVDIANAQRELLITSPYLEDTGARVILQPKVYQRYAVIDKSTLWYGGINFLGFEKAAHGAMRLCSTELANELCADISIKDRFEQLEIF